MYNNTCDICSRKLGSVSLGRCMLCRSMVLRNGKTIRLKEEIIDVDERPKKKMPASNLLINIPKLQADVQS